MSNHLSISKGKGTREGIFSLRTISERYLEKGKDVYILFIDYEKAFDRVNHEKLCEILKKTGIDGKDIRIIARLYWEQLAVVRTGKGNTNSIKIKRGTRQGCVLSPYLFNLFTELIFRSLDQEWGTSVGGRKISNLRYADDTALIADSGLELQSIASKVNEVGKEFGMKINIKKTKIMVVSKNKVVPRVDIILDGQTVEQVSSFTYLGQKFTENGKCDEEIKCRIGQARAAFNSLRNVLCCRKLSLTSRSRLLKCYVWSTLLYGVETWTISKTSRRRLEAFEMWCLRRMMRISWTSRISNENVLSKAEVQRELYSVVQKRKLSFFGHIMRHESIQRDLLEGMVEGRRSRGRPRLQWCHNVMEWTGKSFMTCKREAQDRSRWRGIASNPRTGEGT